MQRLGFTRGNKTPNHLLHTPDTFVRAPFPGMRNSTAIVHAAPALGATFVQYTAEMNAGGALAQTSQQRFLYVAEGAVFLELTGVTHRLAPSGYAFLPARTTHRVISEGDAVVTLIEKSYESVKGIPPPEVIVGEAAAVPAIPFMNDPRLEVQSLLPTDDSFDCAVNIMTFQPGAALPMVEIHVMEHGLLMLEGGGIYRLGDHWYPVSAGDFIWMAPYCPQWFGAIGSTPARYLIYKDFNRFPI